MGGEQERQCAKGAGQNQREPSQQRRRQGGFRRQPDPDEEQRQGRFLKAETAGGDWDQEADSRDGDRGQP